MKTWKTLPRIDEPVALTIGNFDGLHIGHRKLLEKVADFAVPGARRVVISFSRHTRSVLDRDPGQLLTRRDKAALLTAKGIDDLVLLPFDEALAATAPEDFIALLRDSMAIRAIVVGYNFRFGRGGAGDIGLLECLGRRWGFAVTAVEPVLVDGEPVSSSRIRGLIRAGQMEGARRLLGRWYALTGTVTHGRALGGGLGFPTANLALTEPQIVPAGGVYAAWAGYRGRCYPAMTNIGTRPTVSDGQTMSIETHILYKSFNLYGKTLRVCPVERMRPERAFDSAAALGEQLALDRERAAGILAQKLDVYKPGMVW